MPAATPELDHDSQGAVCVLLPYTLALRLSEAGSDLRPVRAFLAALPVWETDPGGEPIRFLNHYDCPCGCAWSDAWSATCDDECPSCGTTCSPTRSDDIEPEAQPSLVSA